MPILTVFCEKNEEEPHITIPIGHNLNKENIEEKMEEKDEQLHNDETWWQ